MPSPAWDHWLSRWEWICHCVGRKGCEASETKLGSPIPVRQVEEFEETTGLKLPEDYAETVTKFARSVEFSWCLRKLGSTPVVGVIGYHAKHTEPGGWRRWWPFGKKNEEDDVTEELVIDIHEGMSKADREAAVMRGYQALKAAEKRGESNWVRPPEPIERIHAGGTGVVPMWESEGSVLTNWRDLQGDIRSWRERGDDGEAEREIFRAFYPLINVGDGDRIVMDLNSNPTRILYLDHDHSYALRAATCLGLGFLDFMNRWSNLGCPHTHPSSIGVFLDQEKCLLEDDGFNAKRWRAWLEESG